MNERPREERAELLARTAREPLLDLADRCLAGRPDPTLIAGPEVGTVMLTVTEPVEHTRFHLGEVLVTRTEVEHLGAHGWAVRMGDDRAASLAAAVLDAEAVAGGELAGAVEELCARSSAEIAADRAREWAELAPTTVAFEEIDR